MTNENQKENAEKKESKNKPFDIESFATSLANQAKDLASDDANQETVDYITLQLQLYLMSKLYRKLELNLWK